MFVYIFYKIFSILLIFRYINAYKERIDFFIGTGEKDMEHCSRLQLCKSLVLTYRNKQLQGEDRKLLKNIFNRNWKELIVSPYIAKKYKLLFSMFYVIPLFSSKLAAKLHSRK